MFFLDKLRYKLYRHKYLYGQYLPLSKPVDVTLELASTCNASCSYCYHGDPKSLPFKQGIMRYETAIRIIDQACDLNVHALKFNWKGESTLNPFFEDITHTARMLAHGMRFIDRITNSNFQFQHDNDSIFRGLANQTKVKISYDSFHKDVFEAQRIKLNHDLVTSNIDKFYRWPGRETKIVIQAVRTQLNQDEDFQHELNQKWPDATLSVRDMVEGRVKKDLTDLTVRQRDVSERQSCLQAHVRVIFNWEGKAFVCCVDIGQRLYIGDIHKMSLKQIFNSHEANQIRSALKTKSAFDFDPCKTCSSYESYRGFVPALES
jgi:radical SAM protein with 4Fe4S-binding SPASM domain